MCIEAEFDAVALSRSRALVALAAESRAFAR